MAKIELNAKGQKVVIIDEIIFSCKRKIDWAGVERLLKQYVGREYRIDETDDIIYIGTGMIRMERNIGMILLT